MIKVFLTIALSTATLSTHGQSSTKTEAHIRNLEQSIVTAIINADSNTLKQLWSSEFMVNNPRNEVSPNREAVFAIQRAGLIDYSSFERVIEKMQVHKNMVVTMGYETFISRTDGPGFQAGQLYKRRFTNIWKRENGKWQQVARHASTICQ